MNNQIRKILASNGGKKWKFIKDSYGHDRVNIGSNYSFHMDASECRIIGECNSNTFITSDRIIFNTMKISDLESDLLELYNSTVK